MSTESVAEGLTGIFPPSGDPLAGMSGDDLARLLNPHTAPLRNETTIAHDGCLGLLGPSVPQSEPPLLLRLSAARVKFKVSADSLMYRKRRNVRESDIGLYALPGCCRSRDSARHALWKN